MVRSDSDDSTRPLCFVSPAENVLPRSTIAVDLTLHFLPSTDVKHANGVDSPRPEWNLGDDISGKTTIGIEEEKVEKWFDNIGLKRGGGNGKSLPIKAPITNWFKWSVRWHFKWRRRGYGDRSNMRYYRVESELSGWRTVCDSSSDWNGARSCQHIRKMLIYSYWIYLTFEYMYVSDVLSYPSHLHHMFT